PRLITSTSCKPPACGSPVPWSLALAPGTPVVIVHAVWPFESVEQASSEAEAVLPALSESVAATTATASAPGILSPHRSALVIATLAQIRLHLARSSSQGAGEG